MYTEKRIDFALPMSEPLNVVWYHRNAHDYINSRSTGAHIHFCYELYVHISGNISFAVNNSIFALNRGDMILTRPNTYHHSICYRECNHEHFCLFFYSSDTSVTAFLESLADKCFLSYEEKACNKIISLLYEITQASDNSIDTDNFVHRANIYSLLAFLQNNTPSSASSFDYPDILQQILSYIGENYASIFSVKQICDKFYISQATMERLFRKYLQGTPYKYIEATKLAGACRSLCDGKSVTAAAVDNGFPDYSHFISLFRKKFGLTPNRYKSYMMTNKLI